MNGRNKELAKLGAPGEGYVWRADCDCARCRDLAPGMAAIDRAVGAAFTPRPILEGVKRCPDCGETKPRSEFPPDASRPSGIRPYCRPCHLARKKVANKRHYQRLKGGLV